MVVMSRGSISWMRAIALWTVTLCTAAVITIAPARICAQEGEESPSPMATPEMMTLPSVGMYPYPAYGTAPLTVGFIPQIHDPAGSEIVAYKWNFGDGHVSTTPPLITYNVYMTPGTYLASLTITTADGRSATGFASVTVKATESVPGS
ncbi:MAG TPA: PKD domain-containing protein [Candidatus Binataceae bacterium]